jgi:alkanesulfonate monooxygenase SsuD/methylene tetrahydromethanopterin reductase-like flavin-dependent oxidoreductase (luciferase family)
VCVRPAVRLVTMQIGLLLGGLLDAPALGALAAEAEALGFASLWAGDHVAFPAPILDPLQMLACFASHTRHVRLGTCVYLLALRHPTVVAKMVSSLDCITGGRVIFGVGVGGEFPGEFQACGIPVNERGPRTNEAIKCSGRVFSIDPVALKPAPVQSGGPPLWIGGRSEAALRRAARYGDGYVGYLLSPDGFRQRIERIRSLAAAAGRAGHGIAPALMTFAVVDAERAAAVRHAAAWLGAMYGRPMESAVERYCLAGPPDECRAAAQRFAAAGVGHLILTPLGAGGEVLGQIRALANALGITPRSAEVGR